VVFVVAHLVSSVLHLLLDWYSERLSQAVAGGGKDDFVPLVRRLISIVIYTIAVIFIFKHFKQDISAIIVTLGVGTMAIALAAKDTIANMIAGFTIMTDRPFRIGDRILLESGEKGDVYDIGLRSTKILTFENTLIIVPNQQIVNEKVTNLTYPDPRIRVRIDVGVAYGTDLDKVKKILVDVCKAHPEVLEEPAPAAYFINFGDSSLDLMVICRTAKWGDQWRVGEELRMEIKKVFEREGIEIPFPQRDVHIKKRVKAERP
jgi:small-conductance mechanosensitive channel